MEVSGEHKLLGSLLQNPDRGLLGLGRLVHEGQSEAAPGKILQRTRFKVLFVRLLIFDSSILTITAAHKSSKHNSSVH